MQEKKQPKNSLIIAGILVFVFTLLGLWAIIRLTGLEKKRDLANWQITLGIMADSRANEVNRWLDQQFAVLRRLVGNGSLQFYVQQIIEPPEPGQQPELGQTTYVRELFCLEAERHGFSDKEQTRPRIKANLAFTANNSLTLFGRNREIIITTPGVSEPDSKLSAGIKEVLKNGKPAIYDLFLNENNHPVIGFLMPVFVMHKNKSTQQPIGVIYGVKDADQHLFPLLASNSNSTKSDETTLIEKRGEEIIYLSPLADKTPALKKILAANAADLAAAQALESPGFFGELPDYSGTAVLFTSRRLSGVDWLLMEKINVDEALSESSHHQKFLLSSLLLALFLTIISIAAAWWHGSSIREQKALEKLKIKSRELETQTNLLNAINDNITDFILLLDHNYHLIFTNYTFAARVSAGPEDLTGKSLTSVMGPQSAEIIKKLCKKITKQQLPLTRELMLEINEIISTFSAAIIPVTLHGDNEPSILITLHDITRLQAERLEKQRLTEQIINALMRAIDLHDPYSAGHSAKVAEIAEHVGREMNLDEDSLATLSTAANLCNLGKLSIPADILTKTGRLTAGEQKIIRRESFSAEDILKEIDFSGPVLETIMQKHEFLDGSGYPAGLKDDEIIMPARILAAVNSYVAMTSPRAYRDERTVKEAMEQLFQDSGIKYDRQVIAALFNVIENVLGRPELKK